VLKQRGKAVHADMYSSFAGGFGGDELASIELLAMNEHDEDGYYKCYARLKLSDLLANSK
jgi:hypothetical protein